MMARLKILEEVQAENKVLMQELMEIREERRSEGLPENPLFSWMMILHTSNLRINEPLVRLNTAMELVLFQGPWEGTLKRRSITPQADSNTGHIEQRSVQEDRFVLEGEFSFAMKEDLKRREVAGVSSPNPFMTTSAPNVS
jgi:hypothetical protein